MVSACSPSSATAAQWPSCSRRRVRMSRAALASSTMSTRAGTALTRTPSRRSSRATASDTCSPWARELSVSAPGLGSYPLAGRSSVPGNRGLQEASKLTREVYRHAGVHGSLLVEEAPRATQPEDALVPDIRMNVEPLSPAEAKAHE